MCAIPNNKLNATIRKVTKHIQASIDEISKLEKYFSDYERNELEVERLNELIALKDELTKIVSIPYYRPRPNQ